MVHAPEFAITSISHHHLIKKKTGPTVNHAIAAHQHRQDLVHGAPSLVARSPNIQVTAASNLKDITLELGGKSLAIIFDDADLEQAVQYWRKSLVRSSFFQKFCHF